MDKLIKLNIDHILFRGGICQKEKSSMYSLIEVHVKKELLLFDKWCENYKIEDTKLTSEELVDKYLKSKQL